MNLGGHCFSQNANLKLQVFLPIYIRNLPADANFPAVTKVTTTILYFIMSSMALAWLGGFSVTIFDYNGA